MRFRDVWTKNDLIDAATVVCTAGQYTNLGDYTVKPKEIVSVGYGETIGQAESEGRIYAIFCTAPATESKGMVRILAMSPNDLPLGGGVIWQGRTEALNSSATDRTKQLPFSKINIGLTEDNKYVLQFNPDVTATITKADSTILMDITKQL